MMKSGIFIAFMGVILFGCTDKNLPEQAPVKAVLDSYYGVQVEDPYRYMENMDDTIFLNWMKGYADYTRAVLNNIPGREKLINQFKEFDKRGSEKIYYLKISENGRYFYLKMTPTDEVSKLYYRDGFDAEEKLLFDPETYADAEYSNFAIASIHPSHDGDKVAVAIAPNGSESVTVVFIGVESGNQLSHQLNLVFGSFSWLKGDESVLYGKTNSVDVHDQERLLNTKVYYHNLSEPQSKDRVIFSSELYPEVILRKEEIPVIEYDQIHDDFYLLISSVERYMKIYYSDSGPGRNGEGNYKWRPLIKKDDEVQGFYPVGPDLYLFTSKDAPNFKIVKISKKASDLSSAELIVPEPENGLISGFGFTSDALYYKLKINGVSERLFRIPDYKGNSEEIKLPAKAGYLSIQTRNHLHNDIWIGITGWTTDGTRYRYNFTDDKFIREQLSSVADFPEYSDLVVEELMITSHDGTKVPLSIIYKKGAKADGPVPLIMNGYGAYGKSRIPSFNPFTLTWTLMGGIYAVSHVRGGGELGEEWRLAGHKTTKPNSWKDFIASAEYLINNGYTTGSQLAIYGGSAGGVLIGRAMTDRPELFAAAIPMVGVMNPVRLEESPNGPVNAPEFGTVQDSVECMALLEMDAYLHIEDEVKYPATLITAGFNDPRVIVWQPAKFAARLQAASNSKTPVLLDVDYSSGHGLGDTKSQSFNDFADLYSFALWNTGHPDFQPGK